MNYIQRFGSNNIVYETILILPIIADSPLFSTLVAQNAPSKIKGNALTIVNCIGFSITIISIQFINKIEEFSDSNAIYMLLAIGPILGLLALRNKTAPTQELS